MLEVRDTDPSPAFVTAPLPPSLIYDSENPNSQPLACMASAPGLWELSTPQAGLVDTSSFEAGSGDSAQ